MPAHGAALNPRRSLARSRVQGQGGAWANRDGLMHVEVCSAFPLSASLSPAATLHGAPAAVRGAALSAR